MSTNAYLCPMCGNTYDPSEHLACQACPLVKGCNLICCPVCGYETVDPAKSFLARAAARLFLPRQQKQSLRKDGG